MKVADASFLIDYLGNDADAISYVQAHGTEQFVAPLPAYAETVIGEGNAPGSADIAGVRNALDNLVDVVDVKTRHAIRAAELADQIGSQGPYLGGCDGLIAAVGDELNAAVVTDDRDLTHPETQRVIDVDEYR